LLSVERTESKKQSASGKYGAGYKPHPLMVILATLEAGLIIFRINFFCNPQG
jgi:hypothetical protein